MKQRHEFEALKEMRCSFALLQGEERTPKNPILNDKDFIKKVKEGCR